MNYKLVIAIWFILATAIICWDLQRHEDSIPLSDCHNAGIKMYHDRPMCTECKLYCEVKK